MSDNLNPEPDQQENRIDNDHNKFNEPYHPKSKHKFEGWPILWILIVIFLIAAVIWYTGSAGNLLRWIDR
ncbi:hypothetical protein [Pedobacter sp. BMA]|uniref:hypothetical protein n=1 Tax=Pedobacter sp. BMA TaxID=1663685 RepID=UPI000649A048|nr:hypothetical protein [Pedobacter sp. BMA]KLT65501.1 hypothetical protein AB669_10520 [Pedobacter sp. BMA]